MWRRAGLITVVMVTTCAATACGGASSARDARRASRSVTRTTDGSTPTTTSIALAATTTTATTAPPAFFGTVNPVTAADLSFSYRPGCPVGPDELRILHLTYWGFDAQSHIGALVVRATVADDVVAVFSKLYAARFPIQRMLPVDQYQGSDPASMDADNTSAFNCRDAVAPGPPQWSAHAYGEAIDVNPVENPYVLDGEPQPDASAAFMDRTNVRPGMAVEGGDLVTAFESVGWQWGGRWADSPDYQHFSKTGA